MKYFTIFIILSFININFINAATSIDDKILEITCLGKYTGVFHNFIYISQNQTSNDYYVIRTPWLLTYPKNLKNALKKKKLYIYNKNPTDKCGWTTLAHIKNIGISTGTIYKKNNTILELNSILTEILSNNYPTLEILLIVIGSFLATSLFIYIYIKCNSYKYNNNNNYNSYV